MEISLKQDGSLPELNLNDEGTVILKFRVVGANQYKNMSEDEYSDETGTTTEYRLECQMVECEKDNKAVHEIAEDAADGGYVRTHVSPG